MGLSEASMCFMDSKDTDRPAPLPRDCMQCRVGILTSHMCCWGAAFYVFASSGGVVQAQLTTAGGRRILPPHIQNAGLKASLHMTCHDGVCQVIMSLALMLRAACVAKTTATILLEGYALIFNEEKAK